MSISPATVVGSQCSTSGPSKATVEVTATDGSGISSVVVKWGGDQPVSTALSPRSGDTWAGDIGPFPGERASTVDLPLEIVVKDRAGNEATASATLKVSC